VTNNREGLTLLVGSGFSQALGIPGTREITEYMRAASTETLTKSPTQSSAWLRLETPLWKMASSYFETVDFEKMLHLAEAIVSIQQAQGGLIAQDFLKPAYGAFMDVSPRWDSVIQTGPLMDFCSRSTDRIGMLLHQKLAHLNIQDRTIRHAAGLIRRLCREFIVTIVTLNYDDLIERAVEEHFVDGFSKDAVALFDPIRLRDEGGTKLIHLHGSIRFGSQQLEHRGRIVKYLSSQHVVDVGQRGWISFQVDPTQSGDLVFVGPIITGLRKLDKATVSPFGYYQLAAIEALSTNRRLVVIGYGGRDLYLTSWIRECLARHGHGGRVVCVTRIDSHSTLADADCLAPFVEFFGIEESYSPGYALSRLQEGAYLKDPWFGGGESWRLYVDGLRTLSTNRVLSFLRGENDGKHRTLQPPPSPN
jgi:SIR2-like protein